MKNIFNGFLLFCITVVCLPAQSTQVDDLVDNWTFFKSGPTEFYQNVCHSYFLQFGRGGAGNLTVSITYHLEGEADRIFIGMTPFTYRAPENKEDALAKLPVDIKFGKFQFRTDSAVESRRAPLVDSSLLDQLTREITNSSAQYEVQINGGSLIIEGFKWNDSSVFTYFENDPGNNNCNNNY